MRAARRKAPDVSARAKLRRSSRRTAKICINFNRFFKILKKLLLAEKFSSEGPGLVPWVANGATLYRVNYSSWEKCFYSHAIRNQDVRNLALQVQTKAPHTNLGISQDSLRFAPGSSIHWSHFNFDSLRHSPSSCRGSLGASSSRGSSAEGSPLQVAAAMGPRNHVSNLHLPQTLTKPS